MIIRTKNRTPGRTGNPVVKRYQNHMDKNPALIGYSFTPPSVIPAIMKRERKM